MTAASKPQFTVWTRDINIEGSWEEELATDDLRAAQDRAVEVGVGDVAATLWERGRFEAGGRHRTDTVLFWWTGNYNEYMGGAPSGRGEGWPDTFDGLVTYEPAGGTAVTAASANATVSPPRRYKTVTCARCGLQMPQNEAHGYDEDVKVGSSSGSWGSGSSSTSRTGSRSFSSSSTHRQSYSSGRTYYRHRTLLLCGECYSARVQADRDSVWLTIKLLIIGVVVVAGVVVLALRGHS